MRLNLIVAGLLDSVTAFQVVSQILPSEGFVLCPGFPPEGYMDRFNVIRFHMKGVRVITQQFEAENCQLWHKPSNWHVKVSRSLCDVCCNCKKVNFDVNASLDLSVYVYRCIAMYPSWLKRL